MLDGLEEKRGSRSASNQCGSDEDSGELHFEEERLGRGTLRGGESERCGRVYKREVDVMSDDGNRES